MCEKIAVGKRARVTGDFMIAARCESLILGHGQEEALRRAGAYVEAGADAILIHSKSQSPDEVFAFCERYRESRELFLVPLIVVPSTYAQVTERELRDRGIRMVIYANQLSAKKRPTGRKSRPKTATGQRPPARVIGIQPIRLDDIHRRIFV